MNIGCPVCGWGADWRWWPDWIVAASSCTLFSFITGFLRSEYICHGCWLWAKGLGAEWDGKTEYTFREVKIRMAYEREKSELLKGIKVLQ